MNYDRSALKREARLAMSQSYTSPYLMGLIFMLILIVSNLLIFSLSFPKGALLEAVPSGQKALEYAVSASKYEPGFFSLLLVFLLNIMIGVVGYGALIFCLAVFRRRENSLGMLFDGFGMFFRIILLQILMGLFIWLWSLLLIIPGIIAAYRYRFAPFLLIDNPHMSAMDCIRESKRLTQGYKGKLFVLDLSFIPWSLLSVLFFPLMIYVMPYITTTLAGFYEMRLAHERRQNDVPVYTGPYADRFGE